MNRGATVIALVAGAAAVGGGYYALPMLEAPQSRLDRDVDERVERARRLFLAYDPELDRSATLIDDLQGRSIDVRLADLSDVTQNEAFTASYEQARDAVIEFRGNDRKLRPTGGVAQQIREGMREQERIAGRNDQLLPQALAEVDQALGLSDGDAGAGQHVGANRLKGAILFAQGHALARKAAFVHSTMVPPRDELSALGDRIRVLNVQTRLVADSAIDAQIADARDDIAEHESNLNQLNEELTRLEGTLQTLEGRLEEAHRTADSARAAFEELARRGQDFGAAGGFDQFKREYEAHARRYREALVTTQRLEFGAYADARIDASGDWVQGELVSENASNELNPEMGLSHYRAERDRVTASKAVVENSLREAQGRLTRLERNREDLTLRESQAQSRIHELHEEGRQVFSQLQQLQDQASGLEDQALAKFAASSRSYGAAASAYDALLREMVDRVGRVSASAQQFSAYEHRRDTEWVGAHILTEQAQADAAQAWIHEQRYSGIQKTLQLLSATKDTLQLSIDPAALETSSETARAAGKQAVQDAAQRLQRAFGGLNNHWTVPAQLAGAGYIMVLLGQEGYLSDVLTNYRNALANHAGEPYAETLQNRLNTLQTRGR